MKVLLTGSREISDKNRIIKALEIVIEKHGTINVLLHGGATGADTHAKEWATETGTPQIEIKPDYKKHHPKAAPLIRNTELAKMADVTVAVYNGNKREGGTKDAAGKSIKTGNPTLEIFADGREVWTMPQRTLW